MEIRDELNKAKKKSFAKGFTSKKTMLLKSDLRPEMS
jgi:hypothetical protein